MNNVDKVLKSTKILSESAKDLASKNLLQAMTSGVITVDEAQLARIISVVNLSIDESYLRAVPSVQAAIKKALTES